MRPSDIIDEIEALAGHYIRPVRSSSEHQRWLADYVADLKKFPVHAISTACQMWRSNAANSRCPTPGQLAALCQASYRDPRAMAERATVWAELSDADYERLSLREKIRYQEIAAYEARKKIPAMWWNGRPVTADELPAERAERWRTWSAQARRHYDEAGRLAKFLKREDQTA